MAGKTIPIASIIKLIIVLNICNIVLTNKDDDKWTLNIVHTNDMHSRFDETSQWSSPRCRDREARKNNCYGGFARLAHLIKKARLSTTPTLFLNAGDTFHGSSWYSKYKWKVVAYFLQLLRPDAMCLGNHEFDNSPAGLAAFVQNVTFPVLASNVDITLEPKLYDASISKYVIVDIEDHKVGIVGFVTTETKNTSHSTGKVIFLDEIKSVRQQVEKLQKQRVDIIIGLGHAGYEKEMEIARSVEGLDLVIGGHTNTFLYNGPQPSIENIEGPYPTVVTQSSGRKVYVVQAGAYTKYLGNLSIVFDRGGEIKNISGNPILLDHTVPKDPDMLKELHKWRPKFNTTEVTRTKIFLDGNAKVCRSSECILGNIICDAMVDYNININSFTNKWTDAAIAILHAGTVTGSIESLPGDAILVGDLDEVIPFPDTLKKVTITGAQLFDVLEVSVYDLKDNDPGDLSGDFLQVSGIRVTYDLTKEPGSKVVRDLVSVICAECLIPQYEPVDVNKNYTILGPSFLFVGTGRYTMFRDLPATSLDVGLKDVIVGYMKARSPIHTSVRNRIQFVKHDPLPDNKCGSADLLETIERRRSEANIELMFQRYHSAQLLNKDINDSSHLKLLKDHISRVQKLSAIAYYAKKCVHLKALDSQSTRL